MKGINHQERTKDPNARPNRRGAGEPMALAAIPHPAVARAVTAEMIMASRRRRRHGG